MRLTTALLALLLLPVLLLAVPARADQATLAGLQRDGGFQEVVISVPDLDQATVFYQRVAGWRMIYRGNAAPELVTAWGLPEGTKVIEVILRNAGDPQGILRLVSFKGVQQEEVRPAAKPWETGAWASMIVRVKDAKAKYKQFRTHNWHGFSAPVEFKIDKFTGIEAIMMGFGGETVTLREQTGETVKDMNFPSRVTASVKDVDAVAAFYVEKLGFKVTNTLEGPLPGGGRNSFGLPQNMFGNIYRRQKVVIPAAAGNDARGAIVLSTYYGLRGDDFAERDRVPNLGFLMVRFPVSDAAARAAEIAAKGVKIDYQREEVRMEPYGTVKVFGVRDPNGGMIEFFEAPTP